MDETKKTKYLQVASYANSLSVRIRKYVDKDTESKLDKAVIEDTLRNLYTAIATIHKDPQERGRVEEELKWHVDTLGELRELVTREHAAAQGCTEELLQLVYTSTGIRKTLIAFLANMATFPSIREVRDYGERIERRPNEDNEKILRLVQ